MSILHKIGISALQGSVLLFYFHSVGSSQREFYPGGISCDALRQLIEYLHDAGFSFRRLSEAYHSVPEKGNLVAVLCCDDGLASVYHEALPILREYKVPLTVFVVGKCLDNRAMAWNHKLIQICRHASEEQLLPYLQKVCNRYHLRAEAQLSQCLFSVPDSGKDAFCDELWEEFCPTDQSSYLAEHEPFLTLPMMRELSEAGAEFALHSHSHADFSRLDYRQMLHEIRHNRDILSDSGYKPAPFFAFPYGRECDRNLLPNLCREASIKACLGLRYRITDNRQQSPLWQRISLEHCTIPSVKELVLKPALRGVKDALVSPNVISSMFRLV